MKKWGEFWAIIPCLSSWRRVKTIPTQITRLATDSATSSSTAPATRAENTNLLAGVIFSRSEEWEVNYPPEMEPWSHGAGPINTIITWHSRVSAAGPVERCPQHQWLTPFSWHPDQCCSWLLTNIIEYLYERFLWFSGILPSEKLENDVFYYDNDSDIKYV